jgi:hypothetical protein
LPSSSLSVASTAASFFGRRKVAIIKRSKSGLFLGGVSGKSGVVVDHVIVNWGFSGGFCDNLFGIFGVFLIGRYFFFIGGDFGGVVIIDWGFDRGSIRSDRFIGSSFSAGSSSGFTFSGNVIVEGVKSFGFGAVKVEPPVTDEVVLVEDGAIGTEEAVLGQTSLAISGTDVEHLALGLGVSVVSSINLSLATESRLRHLGKDGIVLSGDSRNGCLQHSEWVNTSEFFLSCGSLGGEVTSSVRLHRLLGVLVVLILGEEGGLLGGGKV